MIASFTKWDNSLSGTLGAGPMGVPLSEVLLYLLVMHFSRVEVVLLSICVSPQTDRHSKGLRHDYFRIQIPTMGVFMIAHGVQHQTSHVVFGSSHSMLPHQISTL